MRETPAEITVWVCDHCGYWRAEKRTGFHTATNPDDPNGKLATHLLRAQLYVLSVSPEATDA